jgi:hypothetical protein
MKHIFTVRRVAFFVILILSLVVLFHFFVLLNIIPYHIVWGGRIKDRSQLLLFETVSIAINLLMLAVVMIKAKLFQLQIHQKFITVSLWVMFALFLLNTLGNVFSINHFERVVFTPLTLVLALCCLKLALSKSND